MSYAFLLNDDVPLLGILDWLHNVNGCATDDVLDNICFFPAGV